MSPTRNYPSLWQTACSTLLLALSSQAIAVYGEIFTVRVGGTTIQEALDDVQPGDTIEIEDGEYYEDIRTRVSGTTDNRITIRAAGGSSNKENVILRGGGKDRVFEINHEFYTIESFTIDGANLEADDDDDIKDAYRDKLIYVIGLEEPTVRDGGYLSTIDGLIVRDMIFKNAGGECVRMKYFVTYAEIYQNDVNRCGIYDYEDDDESTKNGEGIYIGTSSNQWADGIVDVCMGNVVRNNIITTKGSEGVEVKEGSIDNVIEDNEIYMQLDAKSGGIGSRGDRTIIRNNRIVDASGAGVRVGGHEVDGLRYGINNEIYGNFMMDCMAYGVKIEAWPQGQICGNDIEVPATMGDDEYKFSGGNYGDEANPTADCDTPHPTPPSTHHTPSPTLSATLPNPPTPSPSSPAPSPKPLTPSPTPSPTPSTMPPTSPTPSPPSPAPSPKPLTASPTASPTPSTTPPTAPTLPPSSPAPSTVPFTPSPSPISPTPSPTPSVTLSASPTISPSSPTPSPTLLTLSPTSPPIPSTNPPTSPTPSPSSSAPSPTLLTPSPTPSPTPSSTPPASHTFSPSSPAPSSIPFTQSPSVTKPPRVPRSPASSPTAQHTPAPTESSDSDDSQSSALTDPETSYSEDYEYVGCFANNLDSTTVTFKFRDSEDMTNEGCIEYCRNNGSRYAGTSRGDRISRNGESTECAIPCSGDDSEVCGGFGAVSTWKV